MVAQVEGVPYELLEEAKQNLFEAFGNRLCGVWVHGSRVRGDARAESDLDLFVLLKDPLDFGRDLDTTIRALQPIQMRVDICLEAFPVSISQFDAGEHAVFHEAKREGKML